MFTFDLDKTTDIEALISRIRGGDTAWTPVYGYIRFRDNQFQVAEPYVMIDRLADSWTDVTESDLRNDLDEILDWLDA